MLIEIHLYYLEVVIGLGLFLTFIIEFRCSSMLVSNKTADFEFLHRVDSRLAQQVSKSILIESFPH